MSHFIKGLIQPTVVFTTTGLTFNQFSALFRDVSQSIAIPSVTFCPFNIIPSPILQLDLSYCLNSGFKEWRVLTKLRSHSQIDCFNKSSFSKILSKSGFWWQLQLPMELFWVELLTTWIMLNVVDIRRYLFLWHSFQGTLKLN